MDQFLLSVSLSCGKIGIGQPRYFFILFSFIFPNTHSLPPSYSHLLVYRRARGLEGGVGVSRKQLCLMLNTRPAVGHGGYAGALARLPHPDAFQTTR